MKRAAMATEQTFRSAPSPRVRRPQAERSAETRRKVLSAAVKSLHELGYSATTTLSIARMAGISLGALQHQFPSKAALMAGVVAELSRQRATSFRASLEGIADPRQRLLVMHDVAWELTMQPEYAAVLEVALARRSDPDLARETAVAFMQNEEMYRRWVVGLARKLGIRDTRRVENAREVATALMRGHAVDLAGGTAKRQPREVTEALKAVSRAQFIAVLDGD
jgi:AcrR family transcriptional regulator